MIDLVLDDGDFVVTNYGDISLHLSANDNIVQMANSAISAVKNENVFHPEYGNDAWNQRLKLSDSGYSIIESCAKEAILASNPDISEITSIKAIKGDGYGECIISYTLLMGDGKTISSSTSINIL